MSLIYHNGLLNILNNTHDPETATLKAMLVTSGYTADADHDFVDDTTPGSNELVGTGYARKTLASVTLANDDSNNRVVMDATDLTDWTAINAGTAAALIVYIEVTNDADSLLLCYIDDGGFPITTNGSDLDIDWNASGICYF